MRERLLKAYQKVRENRDVKLELRKFASERNVRGGKFDTGEKVWISEETLKKGLSKKLAKKWRGPFTVVNR